MADNKDLQVALQLSKLQVSALEEQILLNSLIDSDKRIEDFLLNIGGKKKIKEPYEFR